MFEYMKKAEGIGRLALKSRAPRGLSMKLFRAIGGDTEHVPTGFESRVFIPQIKSGLRKGESPNYPYLVHRGTGMYDPENPHWIEPKTEPYMTFINFGGAGNWNRAGYKLFKATGMTEDEKAMQDAGLIGAHGPQAAADRAAIRWETRNSGGSHWVRRKFTKGQKPNPYVRESAKAMDTYLKSFAPELAEDIAKVIIAEGFHDQLAFSGNFG